MSPEIHGIVEPPPQIANAVTAAVEVFARRQNQEHPGSLIVKAISWYHGELVWYVEQEQKTPEGETVVRRLQIVASQPRSPRELPQLSILPGVSKYDLGGKRTFLMDPETVRQHAQKVEIYNIRMHRIYSPRTIKKNTRLGLVSAWNFATAQ